MKWEILVLLLRKNDTSRFDYSEWQHPAVQEVKWGQLLMKAIETASSALTLAAVMAWRGGRGDVMVEGQRAITACSFDSWALAANLQTSNLPQCQRKKEFTCLFSPVELSSSATAAWKCRRVQRTFNLHKTFKIHPMVEHNTLRLPTTGHMTSVAFLKIARVRQGRLPLRKFRVAHYFSAASDEQMHWAIYCEMVKGQ